MSWKFDTVPYNESKNCLDKANIRLYLRYFLKLFETIKTKIFVVENQHEKTTIIFWY